MFDQPPKVGLGSKVPQEFLATISNGITEEDINELLKVPEKINVNDYHKEQKNEDEEIENTVPEANISVAITEDSINDQEVTEDTSFELDAAFVGILEKNDCELLQQEHQAKDGSGREVPQEHIEIIQLVSNPMENENKGPISTVLVSKGTPSIDINSQQEHPAIKLRNVAYTNILQQGISEFNRRRGDPANLIGIVLAEKGGKFKVGTKHGIVDTWLERNSLQSTKFKKLKLNDVLDKDTNAVIV
nr:unnamed protein product [Callosobruchus chinensis]